MVSSHQLFEHLQYLLRRLLRVSAEVFKDAQIFILSLAAISPFYHIQALLVFLCFPRETLGITNSKMLQEKPGKVTFKHYAPALSQV